MCKQLLVVPLADLSVPVTLFSRKLGGKSFTDPLCARIIHRGIWLHVNPEQELKSILILDGLSFLKHLRDFSIIIISYLF